MYKLLAIDLDDTLFDTGQDMPPANEEALRDLDERGVHVVLCSGRPTPNMVKIARGLFHSERTHYVISYNGAIVEEVESGREISRQGLDVGVAREIVRYAREHNLLAQYYHDDEFFVEYDDPRADEYTAKSGLPHRVAGPWRTSWTSPRQSFSCRVSRRSFPTISRNFERERSGGGTRLFQSRFILRC